MKQPSSDTAEKSTPSQIFGNKEEAKPFFAPTNTAGVPQIQRAPPDPSLALKDPLNEAEGYDEKTISSMVLDQATKHVRLITMGAKDIDGFVLSFSGLSDGNYQLERSYGPDPLRTWNIFNTDGTKVLGGMKFDVDFPSVDFNNLAFQKRIPFSVVSNQLPAFKDQIPLEGGYRDLKSDLAYIDNFTSASYDIFRKEVHLIFDDGNEVVIPLSSIDRATSPPPVGEKLHKQLDDLEKSGDLTLPKSNAANGQGKYGAITVRREDKFYIDTNQGVVRPHSLHKAVAPRLHGVIKDLDPDTQDLLFQAAMAFVAGPPMPEGSEYLVVLPLIAKGGMGLKSALAKAAEKKVVGEVAEKEAKAFGKNMKPADLPVVTSGNVRSMGELIEPGVIKNFAPSAKQLPPKYKGFDWYEGGAETITSTPQKLKGKSITIRETSVKGGTWTSLHTILTKEKTTTANVASAVDGKLTAIFDTLHNPSGRLTTRDPNPVAPDTYSRVTRTGNPDKVIVHIHLHEAPVTPELHAAAQKALDNFASKGDLPPVEVIVTGTNR